MSPEAISKMIEEAVAKAGSHSWEAALVTGVVLIVMTIFGCGMAIFGWIIRQQWKDSRAREERSDVRLNAVETVLQTGLIEQNARSTAVIAENSETIKENTVALRSMTAAFDRAPCGRQQLAPT